MLLAMACKREPLNAAARRALREVRPRAPFPRLAQLRLDRRCRRARCRAGQAQEKRAKKQPTVPSTMAAELEFNPHLRADVKTLASLCGCL